MLKDVNPQSVFAGLLAAFVGFASSFTVVLQGLRSVGATDAQATSGPYDCCHIHGVVQHQFKFKD